MQEHRLFYELLTFISTSGPNAEWTFPLLIVIHCVTPMAPGTRPEAGIRAADGKFLRWDCWGSELTSEHASPWSFADVPGDRSPAWQLFRFLLSSRGFQRLFLPLSCAIMLSWWPEKDAGRQPGSLSQRMGWLSDEADGFQWCFATPGRCSYLF